MRQLASEAAGKAKGRTFGAPKPAPLQDTTNAASQPAARASKPTSPSSDNTSTQAIASSSDVALPSPKSPKSPSRHSSSSSRHASFVPEHPAPAVLKHRGSEISLASDEEIKEIERATAIPEEDEGEDGGACLPIATTSAGKTSAAAAAAAIAAKEAPEDAPDVKAHDAIAGLDGAADEPPAPKQDESADLQELEKTLERVGTDLSLMEDAHGVSSGTTSQSLRRESHADTPAATSPIENFEASLSRAGTDLSLLEESRGIDAEQVNEETLKREDHADTPAATSPIERFEASLSRSGTGLDQVERQHGVTSEDVLEEEMRETSIGEDSAGPSAVEKGTGLRQVENEHGVDAESAVKGEVKKEEHIPVAGATSETEDAKEAEKAGDSVED